MKFGKIKKEFRCSYCKKFYNKSMLECRFIDDWNGMEYRFCSMDCANKLIMEEDMTNIIWEKNA